MKIELISRGYAVALIEREIRFIESGMAGEYDAGFRSGLGYAIAVLNSMWTEPEPEPKVIPAKHGYWYGLTVHFGFDGTEPEIEIRCSECNRPAERITNFCPHCGAKMEGQTL